MLYKDGATSCRVYTDREKPVSFKPEFPIQTSSSWIVIFYCPRLNPFTTKEGPSVYWPTGPHRQICYTIPIDDNQRAVGR